jgi:hypothetical protein
MVKKQKDKRNRFDARLLDAGKSILDGSFLSKDTFLKQLPFILFIAVLSLVLIANRYHAEKVFVMTENTRKEIRELRSEKISVQSMLMSRSRQQEVLERLEQEGSDLKTADEPPFKIIYDLEEK